MKVALCCPGPSIQNFKDRGYQIKIAVNRAAEKVACNWWVFFDYFPFFETAPIGTPAILTTEEVATLNIPKHRGRERLQQHEVHLTTEIEHLKLKPNWFSFSATGALILAESLGATVIDVWGADWTDQPDWDGNQIVTNNRKESRWVKERSIWFEIVAHLDGKGIEVNRICQQRN